MKKFEVGKSYNMRSACDHNCVWTYTVIARTNSTITITDGKETKTCRVVKKMWNNGNGKNTVGQCANITNSNKIYCITRKQDRAPNSGLIEYKDFCRYLSRKEIELGQTLPLGYTDCLTYSQMQDVCGDGWTVDVIAHLFKGLRKG